VTIDAAALAHLAALARVALTAEERTRLLADLNDILAHIDAVLAVPANAHTRWVPPGEPTALREDAVQPSLPSSARAAIAPALRDAFIVVPRLASHEDPSA
jgi:aspartyl-tRNA(Asn)/glutamyl-tRNA(Gln) amidotransferase subunit C